MKYNTDNISENILVEFNDIKCDKIDTLKAFFNGWCISKESKMIWKGTKMDIIRFIIIVFNLDHKSTHIIEDIKTISEHYFDTKDNKPYNLPGSCSEISRVLAEINETESKFHKLKTSINEHLIRNAIKIAD